MADTSAEAKSKKPSSSAFKQQKLKAWQPILTPATVLPTFFIIGIIFVPLGIGLYLSSAQVIERTVDYTQCSNVGNPADVTLVLSPDNVTCTITMTFDEDVPGPVFLYYRLTNYYQNHRRYVKSFDARQLQGDARDMDALQSNCDPLYQAVDPADGVMKPIYPCGLVANSLFNDSYSTFVHGADPLKNIHWDTKGIAWPSDLAKYGNTTYNATAVVPPPNWKAYNGTYRDLGLPNLSTNEPFMVWMRTAGLPTFRKLWGRYDNGIAAGQYIFSINSIYPVSGFDGHKSIVISTTTWIGGKNNFLGIAYMVVGSICVLLGLAFLIRHIVKPRKLGDPRYLSWNNQKTK